MSRTSLTFVVVLLATSVAAAQEPLKPITLTLHPPKPTLRKLQFPLLVPVSEQHPGNAVADYKDANAKQGKLILDEGSGTYNEKLQLWQTLPLEELPRKEMAEFFKHYQEVFTLMESGAHRDHADWDHLDSLRKKGFMALLGEDIQRVRRLIGLLSVRIRFHVAEGNIEKAVKDLQTGYTLARHTGESPTLIGSLVSVALESIMTERLDEVLRQPGVPALYWSLSDMPSSIGTLRKPMQGERLFAYGTFPGMVDAATNPDAGPLSEEQVQGCVQMLLRIQDTPMQMPLALALEVKMGLVIDKKHEAAKRAVIASGRPKEKVDAMPDVQVALLHSFLQSERVLDEILTLQQLPPWEALPKLRMWDRKKLEALDREGDAPAVPLVAKALPVSDKVYRAHLRFDRRLAALRCVEALRLYAAGHDGQFPGSLKEIKDVAIAIDPGTGKDFDYKIKDKKATLYAPPLGAEPSTYPNAFAYELTFKR